VLFTELAELSAVEQIPAPRVEGIRVMMAQLRYELVRASNGADYSIGSALHPDLLQAVAQLVPKVVADLTGDGNLAHGEAPLAKPAAQQIALAPKPAAQQIASMPVPQEEQIAPMPPPGDPHVSDLCRWMAPDVPTRNRCAECANTRSACLIGIPNFICEQATARYQRDSNVPSDVLTSLLRYEDGKESHSEIKLNGKPAPPEVMDLLLGLWSTGEFGGNLRSIFDPSK
jgi:hypothetical protein